MESDKRIEELEKENKALKNRCYVLSQGAMCFFCPLECEHRSCAFRDKDSEEYERMLDELDEEEDK